MKDAPTLITTTADSSAGASVSGSENDEDDESYYDACEDGVPVLSSSGSSSPMNPESGGKESGNKIGSCDKKKKNRSNTLHSEDEDMSLTMSQAANSSNRTAFDYDAMYEDNEEELESLEVHGSVISHLISQVKIGMDLTKVVLPTFILERRSLLEMYADFFAHPDLFVSIADQSTPESRFIHVVKWYLSAFHAGRKSSVAKKPYNPILGEVFKCRWEIPGINPAPGSNKKTLDDGPVPGAATTNLTFIAEQVSHHPPISAFYAEHPDKRIICTAHIYTKSQFLGLSVGVHNIGRGSIFLMDHNEEYLVNFPSAYGRSILAVPWIELGGSVCISCPQTGYAANIEFLTKVSF